MKKERAGYYHNADLDALSRSVEIQFFDDCADWERGEFCSGPFKTFSEAKKDAKRILKRYIEDFKLALKETNELRKEGKT